jgi:hypothetical protein
VKLNYSQNFGFLFGPEKALGLGTFKGNRADSF